MLPQSLLLLLSNALLSVAQSRQKLQLNQITSFDTPKTLAIPEYSQSPLSISVALCSSASTGLKFFISNRGNSDSVGDPGPPLLPGVFEIVLKEDGQGNWTGLLPSGGLISVVSAEGGGSGGGISFDIGVSTSEPMHKTLTTLPFFGDTTSTQALIQSHPFAPFDIVKPTYKNYTLPSANMSQPALPAKTPNMTLILTPTVANNNNGPRTGCFLSSQQKSSGTVINETLWARDESGWRRQWLIDGLTPSTNYTAFVLQDTTQVSGPIYFATKSTNFKCPLVHSLPYCPGIAYSVPLPSPAPDGAPSPYTAANLPNQISNPLLSYMANFSTVLTTFACGRDWYSPLVGCDDCEREYRKWLCAISFTRCAEPSPGDGGNDGYTSIRAAPTVTGYAAAASKVITGGPQKVLSALVPVQTRDSPRNPFLPSLGSPYLMLQPCLEQCNQVDRACPPFVGFKCPTSRFNGAYSYGVGYIDGKDGDKGEGLTGSAQDRYGNVWCQLI